MGIVLSSRQTRSPKVLAAGTAMQDAQEAANVRMGMDRVVSYSPTRSMPLSLRRRARTKGVARVSDLARMAVPVEGAPRPV